MERRWINIGRDMGDTPIPYYDENGNPCHYATREEAQREADEDAEEFAQQVELGERTEDEMPDVDEVLPCTVNDDGSVTLEDGTHIPNR